MNMNNMESSIKEKYLIWRLSVWWFVSFLSGCHYRNDSVMTTLSGWLSLFAAMCRMVALSCLPVIHLWCLSYYKFSSAKGEAIGGRGSCSTRILRWLRKPQLLKKHRQRFVKKPAYWNSSLSIIRRESFLWGDAKQEMEQRSACNEHIHYIMPVSQMRDYQPYLHWGA